MTDIRESTAVAQAPHSAEAEVALIGALMFDARALMERLPPGLTAHDFYFPAHQHLYAAIQRLYADGKDASLVALRQHLGARIEEVGGPAYLMKLLERATPFTYQACQYAEIVRDNAVRRAIIVAAQDAIRRANTDTETGAHDIAIGVQRSFDLAAVADAPLVSLGEAARSFIAKIDAPAAQALPTGLATLDKRLGGGIFRGDLVILAGRPSMGKTALANNVARNMARSGFKGGVFSQEMPAEALAMRALAAESYARNDIGSNWLAYSNLRNGAPHADRAALARYAAHLDGLPLLIDDRAGVSVQQIEWTARAMKRALGDLDFIVVDYLQILGRPPARGRNEAGVLQEMTQALKVLARSLNIAVICLSQLSRQAENRDDKRPQLSDLRESGAIEQDADVVIGVFRESYYLERREPSAAEDTAKLAEWTERMQHCRDTMEAITLKQRNGPVGVDILRTKIKHDVIWGA